MSCSIESIFLHSFLEHKAWELLPRVNHFPKLLQNGIPFGMRFQHTRFREHKHSEHGSHQVRATIKAQNILTGFLFLFLFLQ